jgi:hypothetical protein
MSKKIKVRGYLKPYGTYVFRAQDPVVDELRTLKADSGQKDTVIAGLARMSTTTLSNWWTGRTRRPQNASVEAAGRAMGMKRKWVELEPADIRSMLTSTRKARNGK